MILPGTRGVPKASWLNLRRASPTQDTIRFVEKRSSTEPPKSFHDRPFEHYEISLRAKPPTLPSKPALFASTDLSTLEVNKAAARPA